MVEIFTETLSKITESNQQAQEICNDNPQDLNNNFIEWGSYSVNCILQAVEDPIERVKVMRNCIKQSFISEQFNHPQE
jgi:hypothetical protein